MIATFAGDGSTLRIAKTGSQGQHLFVEGCRVVSCRISQEEVDVTTSADGGWRKLLGRAGLRSFQVVLDGVFLGSPGEQFLREAAFSGELIHGHLLLDHERAVSGQFLVSKLTIESKVKNEATYEVVLESAGPVSLA